jgi:PEP-CTERM motif
MTRRILLAIVVAALLASPAFATKIDNYSFEKNVSSQGWVQSIPDWTLLPPLLSGTQGRVGLFFNYDGYTATRGNTFAVLTHRYGGDQAIYSSAFVLDDPYKTELVFDYVYVTLNGPTSTHADPFTVTISDLSGTLISTTVSDNTDPLLSAGSISTPPFNPGGTLTTTYDTGWQTFTVDVEDYIGTTVFVEFRVADTAQGGGGAGVFLDNVHFVPEPGTFLLFGLGALGLTLFGRRKLRRKK